MLVAGLAVGFWLFLPSLRQDEPVGVGELDDLTLIGSSAVLGGLSVVGPVLLLLKRRREPLPWGAGKTLWFSAGTAAWLLWPPVIVKRLTEPNINQAGTAICFAYGTPLMALYVVIALLAGGHLRRGRRRRIRRSWTETFGLLLGLAWACTGLYILAALYRDR